MTNKNKNKQPAITDFVPPVVSLGSTFKTETQQPLIGMQVTLNQKVETYYRVGSFLLTDQLYTAKIPPGLSAEEYAIIYRSLTSGVLVKGDHLIPPIDKANSVLEEYFQIINNGYYTRTNDTQSSKEVKNKLTALLNRGSDRGWTGLEIFTYCKEKEKKGRKRRDTLAILDELIASYSGPLTLYEPPAKPDEVDKVVIDGDGTVSRYSNGQIIDSKRPDEKTANREEKTDPRTSAILDKLLFTKPN